MSKRVEFEIDTIHETMFKEIMEAQGDGEQDGEPPELSEWAEDTLKALIYNSYTQQE